MSQMCRQSHGIVSRLPGCICLLPVQLGSQEWLVIAGAVPITPMTVHELTLGEDAEWIGTSVFCGNIESRFASCAQ